jgi:hypothetical protein
VKRFVLLSLALAAAIGSSAALADGPQIERTQATWQLLSVDNLRFVNLLYERGGCARGNPSVTVDESATRIRLTVELDEAVGVVCPAVVYYRTVSVQLEHPVAGRRIVGSPRLSSGGGVAKRVPSLADLSRHDAIKALHFQEFKVRTVGRRSGAVAFQSPMPGTPSRDRVVRLTIGRDLFPTRRLKRCMERRAGGRVKVKVPKPGDLDAPDLELRLYDPGLRAFVAFYADRARADENAAAVERYVRPFDGTLERRGRISIVWVKQPAPAVAAAVRRCAGN